MGATPADSSPALGVDVVRAEAVASSARPRQPADRCWAVRLLESSKRRAPAFADSGPGGGGRGGQTSRRCCAPLATSGSETPSACGTCFGRSAGSRPNRAGSHAWRSDRRTGYRSSRSECNATDGPDPDPLFSSGRASSTQPPADRYARIPRRPRSAWASGSRPPSPGWLPVWTTNSESAALSAPPRVLPVHCARATLGARVQRMASETSRLPLHAAPPADTRPHRSRSPPP